jgi:5'-nucleotidase / UDP-sugar diphosphatase
MMKIRALAVFFVLLLGAAVFADTGSLLILHTSDLHDYIKPGPDNLGGLPYVAGYVASERQKRDDILLLDSGDVMEKGDMVSFKTQSRIMYEAMKKIGYNAGAMGNHDLAYGLDHLRECANLAGMDLLCLNYLDKGGNPYFSSSKIYEVKGTKIGVIGLTTLKGGQYLDLPECGRRLADEATRLKKEAHLVIVIAHIGSGELAQLSVLAPNVDILLGGHTHEVLKEPKIVPETGALIFMAGQYARYVGRLDLVIDKEPRRLSQRDVRLVEMAHDAIAPDSEMLAWIEAEEIKYYPEATEVIGRAEKAILPNDVARFAAEAIKWRSGLDIAFCHTGQVMRSSLPAGDIDANLIFRTGGQRGRDLVTIELTGQQVGAYVTGLMDEKRGRTEWSGFEGKLQANPDTKKWELVSNLEPEKIYTAIMPQIEWETRFERVKQDTPLLKDLGPPKGADITFTEVVVAYLKQITALGKTLDAYLEASH